MVDDHRWRHAMSRARVALRSRFMCAGSHRVSRMEREATRHHAARRAIGRAAIRSFSARSTRASMTHHSCLARWDFIASM
jgi:hypothetical protein